MGIDTRLQSYTAASGDRIPNLLALRRFLEESRTIGLAYPDVEFALTSNDRLRPDVGLLLGDKAAHLDPDKIPIAGAPDIAVEVISPTERPSESYEKVRAYLGGGAAEVWQVYPKSRIVQLHRGEVSIAIEGEAHITTSLLPNFNLSLAALFETSQQI